MKRLRGWVERALGARPARPEHYAPGTVGIVPGANFVPPTMSLDAFESEPFTFPHCDPLILHSPGTCSYCDLHPDWQAYRKQAGIAFSDTPTETALMEGIVPCPSTYYRTARKRDLWGGNRPEGWLG